MSTIRSAAPDARRALGRAEAFDDAVVGHAVVGEEGAGQVHVFRGDAQPASVAGAETLCDVGQVGHRIDVDPHLRHRDDDAGMAEAQRGHERETLGGVRDVLADEILAGDAQVHVAARQFAGDLGSRKERHLGVVHPLDAAAIVAHAARAGEHHAATAEERIGVFLEPALGRHRENEGIAHASPPAAKARSTQMAQPTPGTGSGAPSSCRSAS